MPITIKQGLMKYKNGQNEYIGINTVGETSSAQQIANINQAGATQVAAVNTKGQEVLESIPSDYTALSDEVTELKDAIDELEPKVDSLEINKADVIISSASGSIASFSDGADGLPVKSLSVAIEPVQDLHGYDSPWPAEGGKNLTSYVTPFVGTVDINRQQTLFRATLTGGKTYTFSCKQSVAIPTSTRNTIAVRPVDGTTIYESTATNFNPTDLRHTKTFTVESTGEYEFIIWSHTPSVSATYTEWQVEESSSFTSYAPYSNICPITGHTAVTVTRTGKNLFDKTTAIAGKFVRAANVSDEKPLGSEDSNAGWSCSDYIRVEPNTRYTITVPFYTGAGSAGMVFYSDQTVESAISGVATITQGSADYSFTTPSTCRYLRFSWNSHYGNNCQLEPGSPATDYEPYQGQTYEVTFPTEAGTVYGGTITVDEDGMGQLVVDRAAESFVFNNPSTNSGFDSKIFTLTNATTSFNSSDKKQTNVTNDYAYTGAVYGKSHFYAGNKTFVVYLPENTYRGETVQICYELATPITYTLTASQVQTLLGVNNIWADCGDTTVTYRADTKLYIEQLTKPTEDDMTANTAITSGKFFMIGNRLFLAIAAIAAGATIIPGTNCTELSLADALNNINA